MIFYQYIQRDPRLAGWYQRVQGRPGWVWKATALAAVLVVVVPIAILALTAVVVAAAVFTVLSLVAAGLQGLRRLLGLDRADHPAPPDDGRENVRVIHHERRF